MNCQILCQSFLSDATCRNVPHCIRQKNTSDKMPEHMWGKIQNIPLENMSEYLSMYVNVKIWQNICLKKIASRMSPKLQGRSEQTITNVRIRNPNLALIFATGYLNKYVRICVKISTLQNAALDVSICVLFFGELLEVS